MSPSNLEILAWEDTPIGVLSLRRRRLLSSPDTVVTEITLDHEYLMGSANSASERALTSVGLGLLEGRSDLRVLVGGLGLGYTAVAALESPGVAGVEVVELLPQVIGWLDQGLLPTADTLRGDDRLEVRVGDVYAELSSPADACARWDAMLIDVDHSPDEPLGAGSAGFYTEAGLRAAREHLAPGGVLGVWSYAVSTRFEDTLGRVFGEVRVEPVTFFNELVGESQTDWLYFGVA